MTLSKHTAFLLCSFTLVFSAPLFVFANETITISGEVGTGTRGEEQFSFSCPQGYQFISQNAFARREDFLSYLCERREPVTNRTERILCESSITQLIQNPENRHNQNCRGVSASFRLSDTGQNRPQTPSPFGVFGERGGAGTPAQNSFLNNTGPTFAYFVNGIIVPFVNFAVIPLLYAIALVVFLIGIVRFFMNENEKEREKGRSYALWGVIGLAVASGVWGLVNILLNILRGV